MTGDMPFSAYSFETDAMQELRFATLIRPDIPANEIDDGTILNFGGHRFRILMCRTIPRSALTAASISQGGFKKDTREDERAAAEAWLDDIGAGAEVLVYELELLEREGDEPLT